ncbi:hypothetical protein M3C58_05890 [Brachybacterium muris]|nr:hypothetical protein [Brachybacterium muris]MCT1430647.1 hypothetical protein [Brachybacterium muris]MCT1997732.1 hypothetical protein [Brachybacterium muris]
MHDSVDPDAPSGVSHSVTNVDAVAVIEVCTSIFAFTRLPSGSVAVVETTGRFFHTYDCEL